MYSCEVQRVKFIHKHTGRWQAAWLLMFLQLCLLLTLITAAWLGTFCAVFAWITGSLPGQTLRSLQHGALYMFLQSVKSLE